jgi:protein-serine/threonine kinase
LLNRNPAKRLGSASEDAEEIKRHPYLATINWQDAINRKLPVPPASIKKIIK